MPICSQIIDLSEILTRSYDRIVAADPEPAPVADYLTDPAAQWVAEQVVAGRHVPMNPASAAALVCAARELDEFYDAELTCRR